MKWTIWVLALICVAPACKKSVTEPVPAKSAEINYFNFNNREVKFNESFSVDLNGDGKQDFHLYTMYIGDALLVRDYKRFVFGAAKDTYFPINQQENVPMLDSGTLIKANAFSKYNWYEIAAITITQKVITNTRTYWEGIWTNAVHRYLPLRIKANERLYYGWVEVSFDTAGEKGIIHRAALCKEPDQPVVAGL